MPLAGVVSVAGTALAAVFYLDRGRFELRTLDALMGGRFRLADFGQCLLFGNRDFLLAPGFRFAGHALGFEFRNLDALIPFGLLDTGD